MKRKDENNFYIVNYTFYNDGILIAYLGAEYRRSDYRVPSSLKGTMADSNDELFARLGLTF